MTRLHVLRVFLGSDGGGGNPLGIFLDGHSILPDLRLGVARELGFSETDVVTWHEGDLTWIRARAAWVHHLDIRQYATSAEVDALRPGNPGDPGLYAWAWEDEGVGRLRSRYFPTDLGIVEDEATGAAAVVMGDRIGRDLTIRQGIGSELLVRPDPAAGTVDVGGRCRLEEIRDFQTQAA